MPSKLKCSPTHPLLAFKQPSLHLELWLALFPTAAHFLSPLITKAPNANSKSWIKRICFYSMSYSNLSWKRIWKSIYANGIVYLFTLNRNRNPWIIQENLYHERWRLAWIGGNSDRAWEKQKEERNISDTLRKLKEAITKMKQEKTVAIKNQKARKRSCIQLWKHLFLVKNNFYVLPYFVFLIFFLFW